MSFLRIVNEMSVVFILCTSASLVIVDAGWTSWGQFLGA